MIPIPFYDLTAFTMQDFPGRTACIVWLAGCNLRCGYCHNPDIVRQGCKARKPVDELWDFLAKRRGLLDGVVLSGGEPTLYPDLPYLAAAIKARGFEVKLDTNGTKPTMVRQMVEEGLADFIALDYKAPEEKWDKVCGITRNQFDAFHDTLVYLCNQTRIPFEVRTTLHPRYLGREDIDLILADLHRCGYSGTYALQKVIAAPDRMPLDETLVDLPDNEELYTAIACGDILSDHSPIIIEYRNF